MELLKQRIRQDGIVKGNDVLKVDSFLNHQMDIALFEEIGKEFQRRFATAGVNKDFDHRGLRHRDRLYHGASFFTVR